MNRIKVIRYLVKILKLLLLLGSKLKILNDIKNIALLRCYDFYNEQK